MLGDAAHYARSTDGTDLAYRVQGHGDADLVFLPGMITHVELWTDDYVSGAWLDRLATFSRLITYDERGLGMSDPPALGESVDLERRVEDLVAVLDACQSRRVHVWAQGPAGPVAILFALTHPDRLASLTLYGAFARWLRDDDYPCGLPADRMEVYLDRAQAVWGTGASLSVFGPDRLGDRELERRWGRAEQMGASPRRMRAFIASWFDSDVRALLEGLTVPTLVLHRAGDSYIPVCHGQYLAAHITGARYVELPGRNHFPFGEEIEEVTSLLRDFIAAPGRRHADRSMATVLFTDIAGSTEHVATMGDQLWTRLLDRHDEMTRRQVERFGGRCIKTTGDGALAIFDLPGRAVTCAQAICDGARQLGIEVRAGLHAGEVELRDDDIAGVAVHLSSRILDQAAPSQVVVSRTVVDLVAGTSLRFRSVGERRLKGLDQPRELYELLHETKPGPA